MRRFSTMTVAQLRVLLEIPANEYNLPELLAELAFRAEQPQKSGCFISLGERCVLSIQGRELRPLR
jgi:hypothetical protein